MRIMALYFALTALNWLVVCSLSWTLVLGLQYDAWKIVAMALFAGTTQTCAAVVHMAAVQRAAAKPAVGV